MFEFNNKIVSVTAQAPATCANVAVGFDLLGFPITALHDVITLTRNSGTNIVLENIESNDKLPLDVDKNVASAVIKNFCQAHDLPFNFNITLKKGIPLGSGLGGSAASAVAAMLALNAFLIKPMDNAELASYAIFGEEIACGSRHADNVVPCLYGGMTLTRSVDPLEVIALPVPDVFCVVVHPKIRLDTRNSRGVLPNELPLKTYVKQSANLASFIAALYENNLELMAKCLEDVLIEPLRAKLVPGFDSVKQAAIGAGALGASLSGSGPSVFAFASNEQAAEKVQAAMMKAFLDENIQCEGWLCKISQTGAAITNIQ